MTHLRCNCIFSDNFITYLNADFHGERIFGGAGAGLVPWPGSPRVLLLGFT